MRSLLSLVLLLPLSVGAPAARAADLAIMPGTTMTAASEVKGAALSSDGRWIVAVTSAHDLQVFDTQASVATALFKDAAEVKSRDVELASGESLDSNQSVSPEAVSADGLWAAGSWGDSLFLWDLRTGARRVLWRGPRHYKNGDFAPFRSRIQRVVFSPDAKQLAVGRFDTTDQSQVTLVLDAASGEARALALDSPTTDPNRRVDFVNALAFSPDGKTLAVAENRANGYSGFGLWDLASGSKRWLQNRCASNSFNSDQPRAFAFSPDGAIVAAATVENSDSGCVVLWDVASGEKKAELKDAMKGDWYGAAFSRDGAFLTSFSRGYYDGTGRGIALWDARSGTLLSSAALPKDCDVVGAGDSVFHVDGKTLVLDRVTGAAPKPKKPASLSASVAFREPSGNHALDADEMGALVVTVTNAGPGPAYAVRLVTTAETPFPGLSAAAGVPVGDIEPGKTVVKEVSLAAAHGIAAGKAALRVETKEANGFDAAPTRVEFQTKAFKAPKLELTAISLGGTGVVKANAVTSVSLTVHNAGDGPAQDVAAELDLGSSDIFPSGDATLALGALEPGASRKIVFEFFVNNRFKGPALPVTLTLRESLGSYGLVKRPLGLTLGEAPADIRLVSVKAAEPARAAADAEPDAEDVDSPPASKLPVDPDAYAVVVGIERYRQEGLPAVDFAARDAQAMRAYLTRSMGFDPKNVVLLENEQATKTDLEKYLGPWLENRVTAASRVFIYYAGHGAPNPKSGEGYLIPYEGDPGYTDVTAFPIKRLYANLAKLPAKEIIVALDACFSGQGGRSVIAAGARPLVTARDQSGDVGRNTVVLSATGGAQISTFYPDGRHGLMTYFLLKGLKGAADVKHSGAVTTADLFAYVRPNVEREARKLNVEQIPTLSPEPRALGARGGTVWVRSK